MRVIDLDPSQAMQQWQEALPLLHTKVMTYSGQTLTPLYGGGVKAGEVDEAMPIRASAIRGHLRYWWRLLYGKGKSSEQLFAEEVAIWGGIRASMPVASRVIVQITRLKKSQSQKKSRLTEFPSYALITEPGSDPTLMESGCGFDLVLVLSPELSSEQQQQVLESLRWWASFGGVGARTRRGLGAIQIDKLTPVTEEEVSALGGWLLLKRPNSVRKGDLPHVVAKRCWKEAV